MLPGNCSLWTVVLSSKVKTQSCVCDLKGSTFLSKVQDLLQDMCFLAVIHLLCSSAVHLGLPRYSPHSFLAHLLGFALLDFARQESACCWFQ